MSQPLGHLTTRTDNRDERVRIERHLNVMESRWMLSAQGKINAKNEGHGEEGSDRSKKSKARVHSVRIGVRTCAHLCVSREGVCVCQGREGVSEAFTSASCLPAPSSSWVDDRRASCIPTPQTRHTHAQTACRYTTYNRHTRTHTYMNTYMPCMHAHTAMEPRL